MQELQSMPAIFPVIARTGASARAIKLRKRRELGYECCRPQLRS
jgi:hypothetical protein